MADRKTLRSNVMERVERDGPSLPIRGNGMNDNRLKKIAADFEYEREAVEGPWYLLLEGR